MPAARALPCAGPAGPRCCPLLGSGGGQGAPPFWGRGLEGAARSGEGASSLPWQGQPGCCQVATVPNGTHLIVCGASPVWEGLGGAASLPPQQCPVSLPGDPWGCSGLSWGQPVGPGPRVSLAPLSVAATGGFGPRSGASSGPARWFSWGPCFGFSSSLDTEPMVCVGAGAGSSEDSHCLAGRGARGCFPGRVGCSDVGLARMCPQGQTPPTLEPLSSGGESAGSPQPHARLCAEPPLLPTLRAAPPPAISLSRTAATSPARARWHQIATPHHVLAPETWHPLLGVPGRASSGQCHPLGGGLGLPQATGSGVASGQI